MISAYGVVSYYCFKYNNTVHHIFGELHVSPSQREFVYLTPSLQPCNPCQNKDACIDSKELSLHLIPHLYDCNYKFYLESAYLTNGDWLDHTRAELLTKYQNNQSLWDQRNNLDHFEYYVYVNRQCYDNVYLTDLRHVNKRSNGLFCEVPLLNVDVDYNFRQRNFAREKHDIIAAINKNKANFPTLFNHYFNGDNSNAVYNMVYNCYKKLSKHEQGLIKLYCNDLILHYNEFCDELISYLNHQMHEDYFKALDEKLFMHNRLYISTLEMDAYVLILMLMEKNASYKNIYLVGSAHARSYAYFLIHYLNLSPCHFEDQIYGSDTDKNAFTVDNRLYNLADIRHEVKIPSKF